MLDSHRLAEFALASLMLVLVPGPATLYIAANGRERLRQGWFAAAGVILGDLVLITLSGLGFAALIARWPIVLASIQIVGGLYLAYLGVSMLRAKQATAARPTTPRPLRALLGGLGVTLTNPKPLLFFGTFLGMFVDPGASSRLASFYVLGGIFELINLTYFAVILAVIAQLGRRPAFERFAAGRLHQICGVILLGIAAMMLITALG